jgi:hypothetical protein
MIQRLENNTKYFKPFYNNRIILSLTLYAVCIMKLIVIKASTYTFLLIV